MGSVRGRSPLARVAARLRAGGKEIPPDPFTAELIEALTRPMTAEEMASPGGFLLGPPVTSGMVIEPDAPPIVPVPADQAPTEIAQRPRERGYPRHGFGQEWPR